MATLLDSPLTTRVEPIFDATQLPNRRKWTRAEFARFVALAGETEPDRYELIYGELVQKMPMNGPHAQTIMLLQAALIQLFGTGYSVRVQLPLVVSDTSEPEPDLAVVEGTARDHPDNPTTALVAVEVADSTLATDLGVKASLYAQARIAEYWVIDINARLLHIHRVPIESASLPNGFGYQTLTRLTDSDAVSPLAAPDSSIQVADLLP